MLSLQEMVRGPGMGILPSDTSENALVCPQNLKKDPFILQQQPVFFFSHCVITCKMRANLKTHSIIIDLNEFYFTMFTIIFCNKQTIQYINPPFVQQSLNHVHRSSWILYIRHKVDRGVRSIGSSQVSCLKSCYNDGLSLSQTWLKNIKRCTATHYIQNLKTVRKQLKKDEAYNQAICLKNI